MSVPLNFTNPGNFCESIEILEDLEFEVVDELFDVRITVADDDVTLTISMANITIEDQVSVTISLQSGNVYCICCWLLKL